MSKYKAKIFLDNKQDQHFKKFGVYADVNSKIAEWMQQYADMKPELIETIDILNDEDFYNLMQSYRMTNVANQEKVTIRFEAVKDWVRQNYDTTKCTCLEPTLQMETKQCGTCKLYIGKVRHILLTDTND